MCKAEIIIIILVCLALTGCSLSRSYRLGHVHGNLDILGMYMLSLEDTEKFCEAARHNDINYDDDAWEPDQNWLYKRGWRSGVLEQCEEENEEN